MKSTRKLTLWQIKKKKEERKKNENRNIILVNLVHINGMLTKRKLTVMSEEPVQPFKHGTSKKFLLCLLKIDQRERQIYYWTKKRIHKSQKLFQPQYISHLLPLYGSFLVLRVGAITKRSLRVWPWIWSLRDNLSPWLKFWGTFSFLGGQKFVHPSADAKGFVFSAGLLIGLGRKSQISRDF